MGCIICFQCLHGNHNLLCNEKADPPRSAFSLSGLIITKRGDNMALTPKEQQMDLKALTTLKTDKLAAQNILATLNYSDTYKPDKDASGKVKKTKEGKVIEKIDIKSELRVFLEAIGTSTNAKSEVIRLTKKAVDALADDLVMITALISTKPKAKAKPQSVRVNTSATTEEKKTAQG